MLHHEKLEIKKGSIRGNQITGKNAFKTRYTWTIQKIFKKMVENS
jgi:hypothetical protein